MPPRRISAPRLPVCAHATRSKKPQTSPAGEVRNLSIRRAHTSRFRRLSSRNAACTDCRRHDALTTSPDSRFGRDNSPRALARRRGIQLRQHLGCRCGWLRPRQCGNTSSVHPSVRANRSRCRSIVCAAIRDASPLETSRAHGARNGGASMGLAQGSGPCQARGAAVSTRTGSRDHLWRCLPRSHRR